jgi:hypothetical protein
MNLTKQELLSLPLTVRAEMAMKEAVQGVIEDHRRSGLPFVSWRDGRVVHLKPSPLPVEQWEEIENPNGSHNGQ